MIVMTFYKIREVFNSFDNKDYMTFIYRLNLVYKLLCLTIFKVVFK